MSKGIKFCFLYSFLLNRVDAFVQNNKVRGSVKKYALKPNTDFEFCGDTPPLNYFDPFNILKNKSQNYISNVREAELQHSRVAMIAYPTLAYLDLVTPDDQLAINYLSNTDISYQFYVLSIFSCFEFFRMSKNYKNPFVNNETFELKDGVQPGKYINMKLSTKLQNKELNNGRLAMIATIIFMAQELLTGQKVF